MLILEVAPESEARSKGILAHDVIVGIESKEIASVQDLQNISDIFSKTIRVLRKQAVLALNDER